MDDKSFSFECAIELCYFARMYEVQLRCAVIDLETAAKCSDGDVNTAKLARMKKELARCQKALQRFDDEFEEYGQALRGDDLTHAEIKAAREQAG